MKSISIDASKCTICHKCIRVCPAEIFIQAPKGISPKVHRIESCIQCAHCVDVCEDRAVVHEGFMDVDIRAVDYSICPEPKELLELLRSRRSNRALSTKAVPEASLRLIVEAANLAPTASNLQRVSYTVLTSKEDLQVVKDFTVDYYRSLLVKLRNPLLRPILKRMMGKLYSRYACSFSRMIESHESGGDPILRGATSLILIHTPKGERFATEDCNLAYQNGSLMAESLGVSQIYTGFVLTALKQRAGKLEAALGINGRIAAGMALGIPQFKYANYTNRGELKLDFRR